MPVTVVELTHFFLTVNWRPTTLPRPSGVVGPPREHLEVLLVGMSCAKRVATNTTIEEEDWTTGN